MQRVLVTGASGYIGQHLIESLLIDDIAVRGFSRGPRPVGLSAIEWQQGDVRRLADVQQALQDCDAVVHLACLPLGQSLQDPLSDFHVNALGTLSVLNAARIAGLCQVVYTSTAQVYGYPERLPVGEKDATQPASPYAASKLCGEILCTTFARCYGLGTVVLRLFNVYGTPVDGSEQPTVEAIFLRRVAQGLPPIIKGNPKEGRDFIHVSDVVRAIRLALDMEGTGEVINVGTGVMTTLRELARLIIAISGAKTSPVVERTDGRPMRIQADVCRARQVLGFQTEISLLEGLSQMLALERTHQEAVAT
ncbi:MAG: NAD-dependent epimerase/dehydratase family protein [Anaerolineae bacterium]|nr:NAD-dependent epimerase/dehydratase family protein [Anaerolineae bacterium]